jgi:hypothetical protein
MPIDSLFFFFSKNTAHGYTDFIIKSIPIYERFMYKVRISKCPAKLDFYKNAQVLKPEHDRNLH